MAGTATIAWTGFRNTLIQTKTYGSTGDNTSHSMTLDFTPVNGNMMVLCVGSDDNVINTPAGWTATVSTSDFLGLSIFTKVASSESTTVTVTIAVPDSVSMIFLEYTNVSALDTSTNNIGQGTATSITCGGITTTQPNDIILAVTGTHPGVTPNITPPSTISFSNSFFLIAQVVSTVSQYNINLAVAFLQTTSTNTYNSTATISKTGSSHDIGAMVGLKLSF